MAWTVETLNETVAQELLSLPSDMQARYLRIAALIEEAGIHALREPHVKHLEGKL
jgi:hypothetical protein